ncbi:DUF1129 family protein [Piscibacillus salipiscarius]|uniref:DUF1129 family protein n=1 Tax=Piscibacillus salipiscarius TaxID=299480 RepID=A0ABW5QBZ1_9BACI
MNTKQLIEENNQKRKHLTKENKDYYEDMLVYIRLAYDKSEEETEEVLSEMLDHLLIAQEEGKTAEDIFGHDKKAFADEIICELPKMLTKNQLSLMFMGIFFFLATALGASGLFDTIAYHLFNFGSLYKTYYLGTESVNLVLSIIFSLLFLVLILQYLKWSSIKNLNSVVEFLVTWMIGVMTFGVFFVIYYFMPDFGYTYQVPAYIKIIIGVGFAIIGYIINKRR